METYEKAYKEALERAKYWHKEGYGKGCQEVVEDIFPELKESEDKKIRKEIMDFIDTNTIYSDERRNRWFSYLEKQGEKDRFIKEEIECINGYREYAIKKLEELEKQGGIDNCPLECSTNTVMTDSNKKELKKIKKNTDVVHEYFSELLENDNSGNIDDYAYQCAYCMSHDWMKDTATWDDVERACKLGAEWNEKHRKSSWSKEDETGWTNTMIMIKEVASNHYTKDSIKLVIDWLESLKDRYTWKPSEEQMHAFEQVYDWYNNNFAPSETLTSLYNDLKNLK